MAYTVCGFRSGFLDTVRLHSLSIERKATLLVPLHERMMSGYAVGANGFYFLERRFGKGFKNFVILNDVAIEACLEFDVPFGEEVGTIELDEMGGLAIKLFVWSYWTEL